MSTPATGAAPGAPAPRSLLPRLTSLRSFAALAVFAYHLQEWGIAALPGRASQVGYAGVTFFFVLSGFVLAWGTRPGLPARVFYRRRFARIWPAHLVVLAVSAVVPVVAVARSWELAVPNALLVQAWLPPDYAYGMNGVSWSLSCEVFFYLLFPLAVGAFARAPRGWVAAVVAAGLAAELVVAAALPQWAFHWPPFRLPEFLLGVALGLAFRRGWRPGIPLAGAVAALLVVALASAWLPRPLADVTTTLPCAAVLLAAARRDVEQRPGPLTGRWAVLAGEASFCFYLVHELLIVNLVPHLRGGPLAAAAVLLIAAAAAALALHVAVERPMNRVLRGGGRATALARPSGVSG